MTQSGNYRPCVGIMLLNRDGRVFVGRRRPKKPIDLPRIGYEWQMPQGGIDPGEKPFQAALRELREETNVASVALLAESSDWLCYDLPEEYSRRSWKGRFQGQRQKWFAFRFEGNESEINIDEPAGGCRPEFDAWRWAGVDELCGLIIPFKRPVYEKVVDAFAPLAAPASSARVGLPSGAERRI